MIHRNQARAREYSRVRYAQNPTLYNQRTAQSRRRTRQRDRLATRTHLRRCFVGNHLFEVTDGRRTTCGDPAHRAAWQRERNSRKQARYRACHAPPARFRRRAQRFTPKARYLITEDDPRFAQ
jgi:hypothetical protein